MMQIAPHLHFNGQCEEAFRFYETALGAKVTFLMKYGESPLAHETHPGWEALVMHATLMLGAQRITGADGADEHYQKPQGFALTINTESADVAQRVFAALAEGGTVEMALEKTFWAERFGMCTDRFGIPWMINCAGPA